MCDRMPPSLERGAEGPEEGGGTRGGLFLERGQEWLQGGLLLPAGWAGGHR